MPNRLFATLLTGAMAVVALSQTAYQLKSEVDLEVVSPLLPQVVVQIPTGTNPTLFGTTYGLMPVRTLRSRNDVWIFAAPSVAAATEATLRIGRDGTIESVFQDRIVPLERHWEPNDPYYAYNSPSGYPGQWHLRNTGNVGGANIDARVWGAWQRDITGQGVTIGICDDSFETTHPDLSPGYSAADSYDFGQLDGNPDPVANSDRHGISVAGVAGGRGGNGIGITGAAPLATLAGLRLPFSGGVSASAWVDAILYRSSGATRTIQIKNHSYGVTVPYASQSAEVNATQTSIAAGTIHVWSAGNSRAGNGNGNGQNEDANKAATKNIPGQVVVAALGSNGLFSYYSSYGASVAVTAPSSSNTMSITTTDRVGSLGYNGHADTSYTTGFGGTSSAAPLVAGVLALVKQVQPALDGRMAKHLLAISSDVVNATDSSVASDGGWRTNAAGVQFNQNYGFGLINADRLTANALNYSGVTALETEDTGTIGTNVAIPENNQTGVSRTFQIARNVPLEEMVVTLNLSHTATGDLRVYLTSPSGYRSRLLVNNNFDGTNIGGNWRVSTNAFWGENPQGTWTLTVQDVAAQDTGTLNSFRAVARMGELVAVASDDSEYVSETTPTFAPGERKAVRMRFKNTGTTPWTTADFRLKASPATASAWGISTTPLRAQTAPGGTAEFVFYATAPAVGSYPWVWQVEGPNGPIGDANPTQTLSVAGYSSEYVGQTGLKRNLQPGEKFNVNLTFKNTGTVEWKKADGIVLRSLSPLNNFNWGVSKVYFNAVIAPGASATIRVAATAPMTPGTYTFKWSMSKGADILFGQPSATFNANVLP